MAGHLPNGLKMTVKGLVCDGDKVAMEAESYDELRNGRVYNQEYHFLLTIRDGRIKEVREYNDKNDLHSYYRQFERKKSTTAGY